VMCVRKPGGRPLEQHERDDNGQKYGEQIDAGCVLLDEHVTDQADIEIYVWTICPEVKVRIAVIDQVNAGQRLVPIKAQVQMRPRDAREDKAGARQYE
jgi:hypothetical protein